MVLFLSFSTPAAFLHSSLYTWVTSNGRSRSGWLRTFQHVLLFDVCSTYPLTCLVTCCYYYCCSYGNALKMCQKLSSHESSESLSFPSRKGRWLFSLGAGNVVYHHLLLYVRTWVVSLVGGCWLFYLFMGWSGWLVVLDGCFGGCAGTLAFG